MKRAFMALGCAAPLLFHFLDFTRALASDRELLPRAASIEILGRSIVYGPQADWRVGENLSLGAGISKVEAEIESSAKQPSTVLVPVFANFYFSDRSGSWYGTGGVTWVTAPSGVKGRTAILGSLRFPEIPFLPSLGIGYEIRQSNGFLFRAQALLYLGSNLAQASGLSFGYAF